MTFTAQVPMWLSLSASARYACARLSSSSDRFLSVISWIMAKPNAGFRSEPRTTVADKTTQMTAPSLR